MGDIEHFDILLLLCGSWTIMRPESCSKKGKNEKGGKRKRGKGEKQKAERGKHNSPNIRFKH